MTGLQAALPRPHYVDATAFVREREQVLLRSWTCSGRLDELGLAERGTGVLVPGRLAVVDLHGESVLVTTTREGELRAHANVCRHRGSQVVPVDPALPAPEPCAVGALRCPYHSWTYDLDGQLIKAPHTDDVDDFDPAQFALHPVGVDRWGGFLWLHGSPDQATPLLVELGAGARRGSRATRSTGWSSAGG